METLYTIEGFPLKWRLQRHHVALRQLEFNARSNAFSSLSFSLSLRISRAKSQVKRKKHRHARHIVAFVENLP